MQTNNPVEESAALGLRKMVFLSSTHLFLIPSIEDSGLDHREKQAGTGAKWVRAVDEAVCTAECWSRCG